jgi:hypothetical protein
MTEDPSVFQKKLEDLKTSLLNNPAIKEAKKLHLSIVEEKLNNILSLYLDEENEKEKIEKILKSFMKSYSEIYGD